MRMITTTMECAYKGCDRSGGNNVHAPRLIQILADHLYSRVEDRTLGDSVSSEARQGESSTSVS